MALTPRDSTVSVSLQVSDVTQSVTGSSGTTTLITDHNGNHITDHNGDRIASSLSQSNSFTSSRHRQQVALQAGDGTVNS